MAQYKVVELRLSAEQSVSLANILYKAAARLDNENVPEKIG